jgi:hypothetical protein
VSGQPPPTSPSRDRSRTADEQPQRAWPAFVNKLWSDPKTGITVVGLLLYAVLRISYVIFYESFGLTPDDLGWGYLDLLGQAAVALVGLTVLTGAGIALYFVVFRVGLAGLLSVVKDNDADGTLKGNAEGRKREDPGPRRAERAGAQPAGERRRRRFASGLGAAAALVAVAIYVWSLGFGGPLHTVAVVGTYCFVGAFWILACAHWFIGLDEPARRRLDRQLVRTLAIAMVAAFVVVAVLLVAQAAVDAQAVREGRSARPTALGMRMASWGAERATLRWISQAAAAKFPGIEAQCLMYLGKSDGTAYFYRPQTKETLRLPASDVAVVTKDVTLPCVKR